MKIKKLAGVLIIVVFAFLFAKEASASANVSDVRIKSVTFDASGYQPTITFVNSGRGVYVPPGKVKYTWLAPDGAELFTCQSAHPSIPLLPGSKQTVADPCPFWSVSSDAPWILKASRFRVVFNPDGDLEDPSAGNTWEGNIPLPDLAILGVSFGAYGAAGPNVTIVNLGNASIVSGREFRMFYEWIAPDGSVLYSCHDSGATNTGNNILSKGRTETVTDPCGMFNVDSPTYTDVLSTLFKATRFRVTVNSDESFIEQRRNNNVWVGNIPLPDVMVSGGFARSGATGIVATFTNLGNAIAGVAGQEAALTRYEWLDSGNNVLYTCDSGHPDIILGKGRTQVVNDPCRFWESNQMQSDVFPILYKAAKLRITENYNNGIAEGKVGRKVWTGNIPRPDLAVYSVTFDERTQEPIVMLVNKNTQNIYGRFHVAYEWFAVDGSKLGGCKKEIAVVPLMPKKYLESDPFCGNADTYAGAVKFKVTADAGGGEENTSDLAETNERNNSKTVDIPRPDLKVLGMNFRGSAKIPEITFKNIGKIATGKKVQTAYEWYDGSGQRLGGCYGEIPNLAKNKTTKISRPLCGNEETYALAYEFQATADVGEGEVRTSELVESNEANNSLKSPIPGRHKNVVTPETIQAITNLMNQEPATLVLPTDETPTVDAPAVVDIPPVVDALPTVDVPAVVNTPIVVPIPDPTVAEPVAAPEPAPIVDTGDRHPSYDLTLTDDGHATYTITGKLNYYGTYHGCTGPRYFDPIIIAWGQVDTLPALDSNNNFVTTHKYLIRNPEYTITVGVRNSCFQATFKTFTVHPKL